MLLSRVRFWHAAQINLSCPTQVLWCCREHTQHDQYIFSDSFCSRPKHRWHSGQNWARLHNLIETYIVLNINQWLKMQKLSVNCLHCITTYLWQGLQNCCENILVPCALFLYSIVHFPFPKEGVSMVLPGSR